MMLLDDITRYMWAYMFRSKDETLVVFKRFKLMVENEVDKKLKALGMHRRWEFTSTTFKAFCEEQGVKRFLTAPYSPSRKWCGGV